LKKNAGIFRVTAKIVSMKYDIGGAKSVIGRGIIVIVTAIMSIAPTKTIYFWRNRGSPVQ